MNDDLDDDRRLGGRHVGHRAQHLDAEDDIAEGSHRSPRVIVFVILGVALLIVFIVLHLTGVVGPGAHS